MIFWLYRILFPFVFCLAAPFYALRLMRRERGRAKQEKPPGYEVGLGQRFGMYSPELRRRLSNNSGAWWLCSISVGETLIALKLARAIRAQYPNIPVVLSVTTSTGYEMLLREAAKLPWLVPMYSPIDFRFATRSALQATRPRALILIEGGIWPNLLDVASEEGVPVMLACARLSPRSERRWRKRPKVARAIWSRFHLVCVSEPNDRERFAAIGVDPSRIRHTGNIKFDQAAAQAPSREEEFRRLVEPLGFTHEILVAGSTWAPEEDILRPLLQLARTSFPNARLIVVPRHVERADAVAKLFPEFKVVRRSQLPSSEPADVLLVDTTGELRDWYRLATVVFVGKSLPGVKEVGGQNPGEPAALGLPIVFGPHMENFASLVEHLLAKEAAVSIQEPAELCIAVESLFADASRRKALGDRAREAVTVHQGAAERTALALSDLQKN